MGVGNDFQRGMQATTAALDVEGFGKVGSEIYKREILGHPPF